MNGKESAAPECAHLVRDVRNFALVAAIREPVKEQGGVVVQHEADQIRRCQRLS